MTRRGAPWVFAALVLCSASCETGPSVLNPRPEDPSGGTQFEPDDNAGVGTGSSPTPTSPAADPLTPPFLDTGGRAVDAGAPSIDAGADAASADSGADSDAPAPDAQ